MRRCSGPRGSTRRCWGFWTSCRGNALEPLCCLRRDSFARQRHRRVALVAVHVTLLPDVPRKPSSTPRRRQRSSTPSPSP
ncbi:hypothetical protein BCEP4_1840008 [Burkholderia cepacia]|nr:hypothetical protein BCEP4_1840008 [Burkholderia cepacia]